MVGCPRIISGNFKPTRRFVPGGCADRHYRFPFLFFHALEFFRAHRARSFRTPQASRRRAAGGGSQPRGRAGKTSRVQRSAAQSARRNFCRAGSGSPPRSGGAPGRSERGARPPRNRNCRQRRKRSPRKWKRRARSSNNPAASWPTKSPKPSLPEDPPAPAGGRGAWKLDEILRDALDALRSSRAAPDFLSHGDSPRWPPKAPRRIRPTSTAGLDFPLAQFHSCFRRHRLPDRETRRGVFPRQREGHRGEHHRSAAAKAEADRELREVEAKIARLDQEVPELREAARRDSAAEAERLRASGRAEIEKIKQAARAELAASERAAQQELRAMAASMAVERAGALVSSRMNREVRARIIPLIPR